MNLAEVLSQIGLTEKVSYFSCEPKEHEEQKVEVCLEDSFRETRRELLIVSAEDSDLWENLETGIVGTGESKLFAG